MAGWVLSLIGMVTGAVQAGTPAQLWWRDGRPTKQAAEMIHILCAAGDYGLRPQDYLDCPAFERALTAPPPTGTAEPEGAAFDRDLSLAATRFCRDLHSGRVDPHAAGFDLGAARAPLRSADLLSQLATAADLEPLIAAQEPQFEHYALLKRALLRYRRLASGQDQPTPAEQRTAPYARRIRQIELTLERWRWLPAFDSPPIIVNIPQYRLFAFESTRDRKAEILQMDVIVGRAFPKLRTPVFAADLRYVIFRPYWDVPRSITQREMLPQIRANARFLQQQHLELVDGQSDSAPVVDPSAHNIERLAQGQLRLRQQPGTDNALGLVKFMLPNPYNVYLHSTPASQLFKRSRRAFSHGCIRVSDPVALAAYVLRNARGNWTPESILAAMNAPASQRVNLDKPIHVLIVYGTALALEDGTVQFFDDIYGHDRRLEKLLGWPAVPAAH